MTLRLKRRTRDDEEVKKMADDRKLPHRKWSSAAATLKQLGRPRR